jgi:hypothetical protein
MYLKRRVLIFFLMDDGKVKQDRQCTYNGTLGRIRATTIAAEKQN